MTELNQITREILDLKKDVGNNLWKIGERLNIIKEKKVYLVKYAFFDEYIEKELDFGKTQAYQIMRIAKEFDMPTVEHWGSTRLKLLMTIEEQEVREQVMKTIAPNLPTRQIELLVKEVHARERAPAERGVSERNKDIKFYDETEEKGKIALNAIHEFRDMLDACELRESWGDYGGKEAIYALKKDIQKVKL